MLPLFGGMSNHHYIAIPTERDALQLFTHHGNLVQVVPDSMAVSCLAFHPSKPEIISLGFTTGSVHLVDIRTNCTVSVFNHHRGYISSICLAPDGRLLLSSFDKTASIVSLDDKFKPHCCVKFNGHASLVNSILPFGSSQCVTCSDDTTIKVWDSTTGECLRTLSEHSEGVHVLGMDSSERIFASGSGDGRVLLWSCDTFEVVLCVWFPDLVTSLLFRKDHTLYAGVFDYGVMSCDTLTGEVGPVVIPAKGPVTSLMFGKLHSIDYFLIYFNYFMIPVQCLPKHPGLPPHMHCGPCLCSTVCTWL